MEAAHAKYYQALMDHDVRKEQENQGERVQFKPRLGARTSLKEFLDKVTKEPEQDCQWVAQPEGGYAGDGKDAHLRWLTRERHIFTANSHRFPLFTANSHRFPQASLDS